MKNLKLILPAFAILSLAGCGGDNTLPGGSGLLEADESIVSSETSGRVMELRFDEGTSVTAGDTLAVIDPSRLELELAAAAAGRQVTVAQLETARLQLKKTQEAEQFAGRERDRMATLYKAGTATQKQLDLLEQELTQAVLSRQAAQVNITTLQAQIAKTDADIDRLKRSLIDCHPLAPVSGVVTEKYVEAGELLSPGKAIAKISQLNSVWVKVYLPAGDFANVKVGDSASMDTESGGRQYRGEVVWTSQEAEFTPKNVQTKKSRADLVYAVKVRFQNNDGSLKIGMPVFVTIDTK